ncbi:MAG: YgjV family protein [Ruminococcaceae bacterium]|nr:YgjV family protein [Oscillospiraceae bacterium]
MNLPAQIVGVIGIVFSLLSFQFSSRKLILLFQMTASLMFSLQLFMVNAITGGCLDLISFVRTLFFLNNTKKWASSRVWLFVFIALMVASGIYTYENGWSLLPIAGSVLSTVALWMKDPKKIRLISLLVGPCWIVYNLVHGAHTGALNEVLAMSSIILGLVRHDRNTKKEVNLDDRA